MNVLIDSLLIASLILFIASVTGAILKAFKRQLRIRYLFFAFLLCFALSLTIGWQDFIEGFNECAEPCGDVNKNEQVDE